VDALHALAMWKTDVGRRVDEAIAEGHTDVLERGQAKVDRIDALAAKFGGGGDAPMSADNRRGPGPMGT
jgi:hypothetical protein